MATYYNQLEITQFLLESGADINARDAAGNTALMGVCFKGFFEVAKILIENGAKIDVQNTMGATALIYSVMFNKFDIAKLLLDEGADKGIRDRKETLPWNMQLKREILS
ncbi:ankyrin repeat domain-containing protein [Maribacter litopenaei]|uniref:Ankyrin repeat domain-containing protein n=1 Tax=Maribacter litopenaei TaxID=2976127 RepID=A0ABY5YCU4_9FLAO|nr:ankyrin repeat domain-containing protein [Maribacter litopenaei]UWX56646.1 ankyrin repeat domain-containing protein [Maribacter litopenaei]